jgi:cytochrome c biogenesis protein CcmG/thiol:disulfide interchange protein DsbE
MAGRLRLAGQVIAVAGVGLLLALLVWKVVAGSGGGVAGELGRGKTPRVPAFTLERLDRQGARLTMPDSLKGKAVVVNFWASWCVPCRDETPFLQRAYDRYKDRGLVVLGVNAQDFRADARRFASRYGVTYPLVYDGRGSTLGKWGVDGFPETFFVDRTGKLVGSRIRGGADIEGNGNRESFERGVALALGSGS